MKSRRAQKSTDQSLFFNLKVCITNLISKFVFLQSDEPLLQYSVCIHHKFRQDIAYMNQVFSHVYNSIPKSSLFYVRPICKNSPPPSCCACFLYHCDTMPFPLATLLTLEVPLYSTFSLIVRPYCLIVRRSDQITKVHRHTSSSVLPHLLPFLSHPFLLIVCFFVSRAPRHIY